MRNIREEQVTVFGGQCLGELVGVNFERGTWNWLGRTVVEGNW